MDNFSRINEIMSDTASFSFVLNFACHGLSLLYSSRMLLEVVNLPGSGEPAPLALIITGGCTKWTKHTLIHGYNVNTYRY